ncbi:MAG: FxsA family protein [Pseudomonadota bacterium]
MWIFAILVAVPVIEIALFIELGGAIGLWPTIGLIILTAILGAGLLRLQGFAAMSRLQTSLAEGGDPRGPMAHGVMILIAGLLMLTPGFFTDAIGFALLIPPVRVALIAWLGPRLAARVVTVGTAARHGQPHPGTNPQAGRDDETIEADYEDLTDGPKRPGGSGWSRPPTDRDG